MRVAASAPAETVCGLGTLPDPRGQMDDAGFMRLALLQAQTASERGDWPFGAVVVRNRQVIAYAYSTERATRDPTGHAELNALRAAGVEHGRSLQGTTLYTTHEPCVMCAGAIVQAKVSRIVIGSARADRPDLFRPRRIPLEQIVADCRSAPEVTWGILRHEALAMFESLPG
jgi:tRNA(adenine34) deaminase